MNQSHGFSLNPDVIRIDRVPVSKIKISDDFCNLNSISKVQVYLISGFDVFSAVYEELIFLNKNITFVKRTARVKTSQVSFQGEEPGPSFIQE